MGEAGFIDAGRALMYAGFVDGIYMDRVLKTLGRYFADGYNMPCLFVLGECHLAVHKNGSAKIGA